jgi:hypothetical protein
VVVLLESSAPHCHQDDEEEEGPADLNHHPDLEKNWNKFLDTIDIEYCGSSLNLLLEFSGWTEYSGSR